VCWGQSSTLLVEANVAGAAIQIDDQTVGRTNEQGTALIDTIQAGTHTVALRKAGYWPASSKVQLEPGLTTTITLTLAPRPPAEQGRIRLRSNVADATVLVDGNTIGQTGPDGGVTARELAAGRHRVVVQKEGYEQATRTVALDSSRWERTLRVQLAKRRSASAAPAPDSTASDRRPARLLIDAARPEAFVRLNDSTRGRTDANGLFSTRLPPGRYTIAVGKTGFQPADTSLHLPAGSQHSLALSLPPRRPSSDPIPLLSQLTDPWLLMGLGILVGLVGAVVALVNLSRSTAGGTARWPWRRTRFDRYELHDVRQRSEFSTVYRANDPVEHGPVTLTVLDDPYATDPEHVQPFLDKGRTLRSIHETAPDAPIVDVYRLGRDGDAEDGRPFIAFEALDGEALLSHLKDTRTLETTTALSITRQVCTGLKVAHANDVHHGSLGPENVIVTQEAPEYLIKLVGFGLQSQHDTSHDVGGGSVSYRAPEQLLDGRSDWRSDMFAAGMLFYKLVTGAPPYADENPIRVLKNQEEDPKPDLPDHIPEHLEPVFHRMISKDPEQRPTASRVISVLDLLQSTT
jgi:hypothetical protein